MTDLIEKVAAALIESHADDCHDIARLALQAIESAGYRIVPVEMTIGMVMPLALLGAIGTPPDDKDAAPVIRKAYADLLAAAPKVLP